ncbi:MAG: hypothetical protein MZV70_40695 [Desulfobacterales bacterium]|nr:hypothetical protein [Desulfobacterales bacterium]
MLHRVMDSPGFRAARRRHPLGDDGRRGRGRPAPAGGARLGHPPGVGDRRRLAHLPGAAR